MNNGHNSSEATINGSTASAVDSINVMQPFEEWFHDIVERAQRIRRVTWNVHDVQTIYEELRRLKYPRERRGAAECWLLFGDWRYKPAKDLESSDFFPDAKDIQRVRERVITEQAHAALIQREREQTRRQVESEMQSRYSDEGREARDYAASQHTIAQMREILDLRQQLNEANARSEMLARELDRLSPLEPARDNDEFRRRGYTSGTWRFSNELDALTFDQRIAIARAIEDVALFHPRDLLHDAGIVERHGRLWRWEIVIAEFVISYPTTVSDPSFETATRTPSGLALQRIMVISAQISAPIDDETTTTEEPHGYLPESTTALS